jgi:uncharacterized membrane protein
LSEWLRVLTEYTVTAIDLMAFIVIVIGTVRAFAVALRIAISPLEDETRRAGWLTYGRWLVAGLTFQLAADIIESSIATSWDAVGRLAAIAVVRTFLNYFLERDMNELREQRRREA